MPANTDYNDPYTISRVISIIQDMNPDKGIGNYVSHVNGEIGINVKLTNGQILVTREAVENVEYAYETNKYSDYMVLTFRPDNDK